MVCGDSKEGQIIDGLSSDPWIEKNRNGWFTNKWRALVNMVMGNLFP